MMDPSSSLDGINKLPLFPDFSFDNREIDALVPSCRVENWQHFSQIINDTTDKLSDDMIYRGHRRADWQLESTLARPFGGGSILPRISKSLLDRFRLAMRGRGYDLTQKEDNEIWAFGQHFGLATPMLDWTASPFVALFFAFSKDDLEHEKPNPTRAVFRINRSLVSEVIPDLFFEPTLGENARLVNQAGLFTVTPEGSDNLVSSIVNAIADGFNVDPDDPGAFSKYICKFHIPSHDRMACLNSLRCMNIHHANLFPDPLGASEYCNEWLFRAVNYENLRKHEEASISKRERFRSKSEPSTRDATLPNIDVQSVSDIIEIFAPKDSSGAELESLAQKLNDKYKETYTVDWPNHDSASARLRVAFKRLMRAAGFSEPSRDKAAETLLDLYADHYREAEKSI